MGMLISDRPALVDQSEPVCNRCGHGQGLHAESSDVECVACIERGEALDCPSFSAVAAGWGTGSRPRTSAR
jgi:hypothetical protein